MSKNIAPKIVIIGGGTGSFELLSGIKHLTPNVTALVSMADDGGSTGVLRDDYGVLPPGDIRKALVALSRAPQMRDLFNYRFEDGGLAGHSFGNLFLTAVEKMSDNFTHAVELASQVLNITGRVLPITLDKVTLELEVNGRIIYGEHQLDKAVAFAGQRPIVRLQPRAHVTHEAEQALQQADIIVIAPGSLYGSLAAVLVVDGVAEALQNSPAKKVYVCNLVTEHGQTDGFMVHDYVAEVQRFLGGAVKLDYVLYNVHRPDEALLDRYYTKEHRSWVEYDKSALRGKSYIPIGDNFVHEKPDHSTVYIRHNGDKVAEILAKLINKGDTVKT